MLACTRIGRSPQGPAFNDKHQPILCVILRDYCWGGVSHGRARRIKQPGLFCDPPGESWGWREGGPPPTALCLAENDRPLLASSFFPVSNAILFNLTPASRNFSPCLYLYSAVLPRLALEISSNELRFGNLKAFDSKRRV